MPKKKSDPRVLVGNCLDTLKTLDDCSIDSIVTDPPYELGFMGKQWDASGIAYNVDLWRECLRVLKPGGHLLAFGGTRTYHRMVCAIEDAGFEIRDSIHWVYGSGFPKSLDVSKAIDKAADAKREVVGTKVTGKARTNEGWQGGQQEVPVTAKQWQGWGTALKPAHEPIVVARKPLEGTVAANVLKYGTGALNIDGCRVGSETITTTNGKGFAGSFEGGTNNNGGAIHIGRWPANIIFDEDAGAELDAQSGIEASRFFYSAKPSKKERNAGLDGLPVKRPDTRTESGMGTFEEKGVQPQRNFHPTVKPVALMRWLVRLVTPPNGVVLDPFLGSGTTAVAAVLEGFDWRGCEMTAEYLPIIEGRIAWAASQIEQPTLF